MGTDVFARGLRVVNGDSLFGRLFGRVLAYIIPMNILIFESLKCTIVDAISSFRISPTQRPRLAHVALPEFYIALPTCDSRILNDLSGYVVGTNTPGIHSSS